MLIGYQLIARTMPFGSMTNVARTVELPDAPGTEALTASTKLVNDLTAYSASESARLKEQAEISLLTVIVASAFGLLTSIGIAVYIAIKGLAQPIAKLKVVMSSFASNDFNHNVPGMSAEMNWAKWRGTVEIFKNNGLDVARMRDEQQATEVRSAQQRKEDMIKLADDFESAVGKIIQTVSAAAVELETSANSLTATADRNEELSTAVAAAAEEASVNVQSVASASEEMSSSVSEISRQVHESARIASDAVSQAEATNAKVNDLSDSAKKNRRCGQADFNHRGAD